MVAFPSSESFRFISHPRTGPNFAGMQKLHLLQLFTCIISFPYAALAFSVTVGTPTQCGDLPVSWTGKPATSMNCILSDVRYDCQVDKHRSRSY